MLVNIAESFGKQSLPSVTKPSRATFCLRTDPGRITKAMWLAYFGTILIGT